MYHDLISKTNLVYYIHMANLNLKSTLILVLSGFIMVLYIQCTNHSSNLRIGTFKFNVTPPIGSPVAYAMTRSIDDSLFAKGIIILSEEEPIVLCAVDWIGIANEGLDAWRTTLAEAAGTSVDRVSVHALHQHDGVRCDFTTSKILDRYGLGGWRYDTDFLHSTISLASNAVQEAKNKAQIVTHIGTGKAIVDKVASNRRVLGSDGMVEIVRYSRTTDSAAIAAPEGLIDPWLKCVSFWNEDQPIVTLNYYTTHPMSHYGLGDVSSDFVGIARESREDILGFPQIYLSGAGGNITAGKYNDGSPERRYVLADRVEKAMTEAWESTKKSPIVSNDLTWNTADVQLPLGAHLVEAELISQLESDDADSLQKFTAAKHLAWLNRTNQGHPTQVSALSIKDVWLLNLPGELFVEYQLAAQEMRPNDFVCTAAYEEYGPGYVCTEIAYSQGGYESSDRASRVGPEVEAVLMSAIEHVLQ
jgi:hypothetical protein